MKFRGVVLIAASLALPAAVVAQTTPAAPRVPKVAVIDVQRLLLESAPGKEAQAKVQKMVDAKQKENQEQQKDLQGLQQKLQTQGPSMSDDARDKLNDQYQQKAISYKRFQDDAQRQVQDLQQRELQELEKRVMPIISQIGKEQGYTLIFNKFNSGLVYAADTIDITEEVLHRFNTAVSAPPAPAGNGAHPAAGKPHTGQ